MSVIDDAALLKMAEAELLGEAKRAAARHSTAGVSGWQPVPKPNKMFLTNTILQTIASNRVLSKKAAQKGDKTQKRMERKLLQRKSKTLMDNNFVYMKPVKRKEKPIHTTKTSKLNNVNVKTSLEDNKSKNVTEVKQKCNIKKIKKV